MIDEESRKKTNIWSTHKDVFGQTLKKLGSMELTLKKLKLIYINLASHLNLEKHHFDHEVISSITPEVYPENAKNAAHGDGRHTEAIRTFRNHCQSLW